MLRRHLKQLDSEYKELEQRWLEHPSFEEAVRTLAWCKTTRDRFDESFQEATTEPMLCRVDVLGHCEVWQERVSVWRKRFEETRPNAT